MYSLNQLFNEFDLWPWWSRALLWLAICLIALLACYLLSFRPLQQDSAQLHQGIDQQRQAQTVLAALNGRLKPLYTQVADLERRLSRPRNLSHLVDKISQISNKNQLDLISLELKGNVSLEPFSATKIKVILTGGFHSIASFFSDLTTLEAIAIVQHWSIKKQQSPSLQLTLNINLYFQDEALVSEASRSAFQNSRAAKVDPLFTPIPYTGTAEVDIFRLETIEVINRHSEGGSITNQPAIISPLTRQWGMVGSVQRGQYRWGIIRNKQGDLRSIQAGEFIENSRAIATEVTEDQVHITELIEAQGAWSSLDYFLTMSAEEL